MRSPTRIMAATTLSLEALVVLFAGLVAKDLSSLSVGAALGITSALALALFVAAGMLRRRAGYLLGSALQVLVFGFGFWVHTMFFVGVMFTALWITSLVMGERAKKIAEERWGAAGAGSHTGTD